MMTNITSEEDLLLKEYADKKAKEFIPAMFFVGVFIIAGVLGNVFTIIFYGFKIKRNPSNLFISTLAVVDLITCLVIVGLIIDLRYIVNSTSVVGCRINSFLNYWCVYCSVFMLVVISVDRYRKLCAPLKRQFTMMSAKVAIAIVIFISLVIAVKNDVIVDLQQVNVTNSDNETFKGFHCSHTTKDNMRNLVTSFFVVDLLVPLSILIYFIVVYTLIIRSLIGLKISKMTQLRLKIEKSDANTDNITNCESETSNVYTITDSIQNQTYQDSTENVNKSNPESENDHVRRLENIDNITNNEIESNTKTFSDLNQLSQPSIVKANIKNEITKPNYEGSKTFIEHNIQSETVTSTSVTITDSDSTHGTMKADTHSKQKKDNVVDPEIKITLLMIVITIVFILSFTPYFIIILYVDIDLEMPIYELNVGIQIVFRFFVINSAANPYIFLAFNSAYRNFVHRLCKQCLCIYK